MEEVMKIARWTAASFLILLFSIFLFAADVTGKWKGPMQGGGEAVLTLKSVKGVVSGTMLGPNGKDYPITEGKLDGDSISLTVASEWQGQPTNLLVTGKVSGDQMQLHIASDSGSWATDATVKRESK
jgi:hypothetical protein